ncbi:MAG: hypothetical protein ACREJ6_01465 [Candidatus Methylomirabilis sp.]
MPRGRRLSGAALLGVTRDTLARWETSAPGHPVPKVAGLAVKYLLAEDGESLLR